MAGCADYKRPMYRVVATDVELDAAMPALELASTVALDTEFHPERTYRPRLLLVQLCVSGLPPLILDPLGGLTLRRLGPVLAQARLVVHGGVWDLRLLADHAGLVPRVVSDTQLVAAFAGLGWPRRRYLLDLTYRAFTAYGHTFQCVRLSIRFDLVVLQPRRLTTPVWAFPVSLATTQGITFVFSSSGY